MRHVLKFSCLLRFQGWEKLSRGSYWNRIRNPAMVTVSMEWRRSMTDVATVTEHTTIPPRAVQPLEYLEAARCLWEQPVRDIAEYQDRRWWAEEVPSRSSCVLTSKGDEHWLMVSKTQIPPAPPVSKDAVAHLLTGITDPESERTVASDHDDEHAELKRSATYPAAKVVDDWDAEALVRPTNKTLRSHADLLRPVTTLIGNIL
jgi:hypothetical protein